MKPSILLIGCCLLLAACGEDEVQTEPPTIVGAELQCIDDMDEDFQIVEKVLIEITDADRDLVPSSIMGTVNGLMMDEFTDPDADEKYEWVVSTALDPPVICEGEFTIIVEAADAEGNITRETLTVTP